MKRRNSKGSMQDMFDQFPSNLQSVNQSMNQGNQPEQVQVPDRSPIKKDTFSNFEINLHNIGPVLDKEPHTA